jgi:heme/copper-type cytochrome/quinol oxidase subunit 4
MKFKKFFKNNKKTKLKKFFGKFFKIKKKRGQLKKSKEINFLFGISLTTIAFLMAFVLFFNQSFFWWKVWSRVKS